jgi:hypothetical protein
LEAGVLVGLDRNEGRSGAMATAERWPAAALVEALRGHTVIDASCDAEGVDDVRLRLEDGTVIRIDARVTYSDAVELIEFGLAGPWAQLEVAIGGANLWSHDL